MIQKQVNNNNGIGVLGLLGIVFVVLKLTEVIDWSWWFVTLPFWGGFALIIVAFVMAFGVAVLVDHQKKKKIAELRAEKEELDRLRNDAQG